MLLVSLYGSPSPLLKHSVDQEGPLARNLRCTPLPYPVYLPFPTVCRNTVQLMLIIIYFLYVSSMILFCSLAVAYWKENLVYLLHMEIVLATSL